MFAKTKSASDASPLRVTVTQPAPCQHRLQIQLAPVGVAPVREDVVRQFQKEAALVEGLLLVADVYSQLI